jgi:transposase
MCIQSLANYFNINWHTVKAVEKSHLRKKYKKISLANLIAIGIDEVYMGKKLGDKGYLTIVRDLSTGATLFVGKGKSSKSLKPLLQKLKSTKSVIEFVAVDLAPSFTSWIKENLPDATIVYDHFHVIKLMNDRLNKVRRRITRELGHEDKGEIKGLRWKFNRNNEDLEPTAQSEIKECCSIFTELGVTYTLKEALRRIYKIRILRLLKML